MSLANILRERRLLVCVGPGGVGKTTLAAALALEAAHGGRRVAVITIDPARRLADALGLDGLDDALRSVPRVPPPGQLHAAMLETKASYDALIGRITADPAARARILENRVYQAFSRTLARSHAYVAMERLHDVLATGAYDLVVLDTPPTRTALDILEAPDRLLRFLDERVVSAFVGQERRGAGAWIRAKGTEVALHLFAALVGESLVGELIGFFEAFLPLREGFARRAAMVQISLRSESTAFVLVGAPDATHLADAVTLRDGLLERGARLEVLLVNRAFHADAEGLPIVAIAEPREPAREGPPVAAALREAGAAVRARLARDNVRLDAAAASLEGGAGSGTSVRLRFPILDEEPTTLEGLRDLLARGR